MLAACVVLGYVAVLGAVIRHCVTLERETGDVVEVTQHPRSFGRIEKERALAATNAHYE